MGRAVSVLVTILYKSQSDHRHQLVRENSLPNTPVLKVQHVPIKTVTRGKNSTGKFGGFALCFDLNLTDH